MLDVGHYSENQISNQDSDSDHVIIPKPTQFLRDVAEAKIKHFFKVNVKNPVRDRFFILQIIQNTLIKNVI